MTHNAHLVDRGSSVAGPRVSEYTISSVCLRGYDFAQALEVAKRLGFDSLDLVGLRGLCEHVPVNGSTADLRAAAEVFRRSGLRGASVNADPGSFDGFDDAEDVRRRIDGLLGFLGEAELPLLVLPCGEKTAAPPADPQISRMADALNGVAASARAAGVRLAVEAPYFGRPIHSLERAEQLLAALDPAIELAYDVSHVEAADESVVAGWDRFADRIGIVHLRDAASGDVRRVIGAGRVDFAAFLHQVRASDFSGDVVLELETQNSPYASKEDEVMAAALYLGAIEQKEREIVR
ncbi:sugar phosphate isomerase/epimerase family protein [Microbacterium sp. B2969]|uniref:Sugar phosphate isomerase/epimerase family protein n=1 Tax=Microbacterium alkaliflavum TaxID=3248839 RepID=A0ABW7Q3F5_9MICO